MITKRTQWNDAKLHAEILEICVTLRKFPSTSELQALGRGDISNQLCRRGGMEHWAKRVGYNRAHSDSDTGWDGELKAMKLFEKLGIPAIRPTGCKSPFDILLDGALKVDVKTANFKTYGPCSGWFYRIGKYPQSDLILLVQADGDDFYALPWWACPRTNVTISKDGGKYASRKNDIALIRAMLKTRKEEQLSVTN